MKISLITLHRVLNYGSVLQTYATSELFKKYGYEVEVVDYLRKKDLNEEKLKNFTEYRLELKKKKVENNFKKFIYNIIYNTFLYKSTEKFYNVCNNFLKENIILSKEQYTTHEKLRNISPKADIYCVGSDQVWNPIHNEGVEVPYYLDFADKEAKKISLASSLGLDEISTTQKSEIMKYLNKFDAISTREKATSKLFNNMGLNAEHVVDPTMLIEKEKWESLVGKRQIDNKYLLVYQFGNNDTVNNVAYSIATKKGLEVVHIGFHKHQKLKKKGKFILVPTVDEFLSLFYYADFVVTNSFHGTCFSIKFNKNFAVILRDQFNIRMNSILESVGLLNRIIIDKNKILELDNDINYEEVEKRVEKIRIQGLNWVEKQLNTDS